VTQIVETKSPWIILSRCAFVVSVAVKEWPPSLPRAADNLPPAF